MTYKADKYIIDEEELQFIEKRCEIFLLARTIRSHPYQSDRDKAMDELKEDLKTRFVSSSNQWSKGRNSGLLECCNIIDEYLRKQVGKP
jgi:hypothetical protein